MFLYAPIFLKLHFAVTIYILVSSHAINQRPRTMLSYV